MRTLNVGDYVEGERWVCRKSRTSIFTEGKMYTVVSRGGRLRLMGNNRNIISTTSSKFEPFEMPNLSEYE